MLRSLEGSDASVQGTNDDAQISKLSCAKAGYFRDEFIQFFVRRASRRSPLINRGYYSRHAALRQLLLSFLDAARAAGPSGSDAGSGGGAGSGSGAGSGGGNGGSGSAGSGGANGGSGAGRVPQVLVLGAGFDTTWFQLARDAGGRAAYRCLEVDFKEVTQRKAAIIAKEPQLHSLLCQPPTPPPPPFSDPRPPPSQQQQQQQQQQAPEPPEAAAAPAPSGPGRPGFAAPPPPPPPPCKPGPESGPGSGAASYGPGVDLDPGRGQILSSHYCLVPVDLRDTEALDRAVQLAGWDRSAPTYVLSECVLVYLEPQHSSAVVRWAAGAFSSAAIAIYEQVRPDDAFGRQMVSNLEARGCPLRGLHATPSLEAHRARLLQAGWSWADARDMDELYRAFLDPADRSRAERLELFDELEEWHMIQEHYCIALGRNDAAGWLTGFGFGAPRPAAATAAAAATGAGPGAGRWPMPPPTAGGRPPLVVD